MNPEVMARVLALLEKEDQRSRNLNFQEFSSREGQTVFRLYRMYLSLIHELEQAAARPEMRVTAQSRMDGLWLTVEDPKVSYRRDCLVPGALAGHFMQRLRNLGLGPGE